MGLQLGLADSLCRYVLIQKKGLAEVGCPGARVMLNKCTKERQPR